MIILNDVSKKLDDNVILNNVNIQIEEGKIYGFVGRNGSGKSVLFKLIVGLFLPTSGTIKYENVNIYKDVRALIEKPNFIDELSGLDNLKLLASIQNRISNKDIEDIMKQLNIYNDKDKKYSKYSLGMKQKLGIAQVFMENPKYMILDEPFAGLDDESVKKLRTMLINYKKQGVTILLSSHIKEDIDLLADEIYEVKNGTIEKKNK